MQTLHTDNKMKSLVTDTKLQINISMHGYNKGQVVDYGRATPGQQTNLRRRFADNDGSVEIVETKTEPKLKPKTKPVSRSTSKASETTQGDS